jgi:phosphonate transport system substrate-binding protein
VIALWVVLLVMAVQGHCKGAEKGVKADPFDITVAFSPRAFVEASTDEAKAYAKTLTRLLLSKNVGGAIESIIFNDMISLEKAIIAKKVDMTLLLSDEFLEIKDRLPLDPTAVSTRHNSVYEQVGIWVRRDCDIRTVADLRNKSIYIQRGLHGPLLQYWVETLFMKEGVHDDGRGLFSKMQKVEKPSHAVLPVFFRQADACVVSNSSFELANELNPQLAQDLEMIVQSPNIVGGAILCFRRDYPQVQKEIVQKALWSMHEETEGRQIFTLFRMDRFVPYRPEYLRSMETFLMEYRAHKMKMAREK